MGFPARHLTEKTGVLQVTKRSILLLQGKTMQSPSSYEKRTRIDKNVVEWNVEVCPNSGSISAERIATTRKSISGDFEPTAHYER